MPFLFRPPFEMISHLNERLRYRVPEGVTIYRVSGEWRQERTPPFETLQAAERFYVGGYVYLVTDEEAADLDAAGFGAGLEEVTA